VVTYMILCMYVVVRDFILKCRVAIMITIVLTLMYNYV
jgi:hypothetical protein